MNWHNLALIITLAISLMSVNAYGNEIFEHINPDGSITYSDKPMGDSDATVKLPSVSTAPASTSTSSLSAQQTPAPKPDETQARKPYIKLEITSPQNQESIQNQPILAVDVSVDPPLQTGDRIQVYLDGNPLGKAEPHTHFEFTIPYRGEHTLSAAIFDKDMKLLKQTPATTIYVHQAHIGS